MKDYVKKYASPDLYASLFKNESAEPSKQQAASGPLPSALGGAAVTNGKQKQQVVVDDGGSDGLSETSDIEPMEDDD